MNLRSDLTNKLWQSRDPFAGFAPNQPTSTEADMAHGPHPYLLQAIAETRPKLVVEIGVWKGASSIAMAKQMKAIGVTDCVLISIDTWLGSAEHWMPANPWHESLNLDCGQPMVFRTFMANVLQHDVADIILPLPLDSVNANELFKLAALPKIDVLHVDAGHDYRSVISDLEMWWPLVEPGGWLIGDDYLHTGEWPGVRQAFDEFFNEVGLAPFEFGGNKCKIKKPEINQAVAE